VTSWCWKTCPKATSAFALGNIHHLQPTQEHPACRACTSSNDSFFTQCEAEGFRRITYFLDRPDVMASYTRHPARRQSQAYPVLLSNGNLVEHTATWRTVATLRKWVDPHQKPGYLFALVAGQLVCREQRVIATLGQRACCCRSTCARVTLDKTEHAMNSLDVPAWPGTRHALACSLDLERFMIVATSDFNMGAMENKGLNIFNTKYVLAQPGHRHRHRLQQHRARGRRTSISTTGPATASPAATGFSSRSKKASRCSATRSSGRRTWRRS
jgi:aminopeptidase N